MVMAPPHTEALEERANISALSSLPRSLTSPGWCLASKDGPAWPPGGARVSWERSDPAQCFSNWNMHMNGLDLVKMLILIQLAWGGA